MNKSTPIDEQIDNILLEHIVLATDNGQPYIKSTDTATDKIVALIAKECNKAKMEQLKYMEQFAQKQDIDWDFIANMIGQLELSNKENK